MMTKEEALRGMDSLDQSVLRLLLMRYGFERMVGAVLALSYKHEAEPLPGRRRPKTQGNVIPFPHQPTA